MHRKRQWQNIWKVKAVRPIPKVHPEVSIEDLRNKSGLANLNKVTKTIIAELMLSDMKDKPDKSHDGNQN